MTRVLLLPLILKGPCFPPTLGESMNSVFIIYRGRTVTWIDSPNEPRTWADVGGSVWTEDEVRSLADKARAKGTPLISAEVTLAFTLRPACPPTCAFMPGRISRDQNDPLAADCRDCIPTKAYLTREEAERGEEDWDYIWAFPLPWIGRVRLTPSTLNQFPEGGMDTHK